MKFAIQWILLAALICSTSCQKKTKILPEPLLCYIGGTMRPVMDALKQAYEAKTSQKIDYNPGESGTLIINVEETHKGDLIMVHDPFQITIHNKGLEDSMWVVASLRPVIVVGKGNPKKIVGLKSLGEKGLRIILTHPQYSTMGHMVPVMTRKAGNWDAVKANVVTETRSGAEAANAVSLGTADAAIVWNAVAYLRTDKLDTVSIEPAYRLQKGVDAITSATYGTIDMGEIRVTLSTLKCSKHAAEAKAFAEFCASPEAEKTWKEFGFCICNKKKP
ncbi:MAG: extracellular solute-binding protein [Fibrobacterota bacterium]